MEIEINFKDSKSNQNKANMATEYMSSKKKDDNVNEEEDGVLNTLTGCKYNYLLSFR